MKVALASCTNLPGWEKDDHPFQAALEARGCTWQAPPWDDPDVDWSSFDAVLIRTTWDYMERQADFVAWARAVASQTRFYNPPEVVAWNTHKSYLRELESAGVPIAPTVWLETGASVDVAGLMNERGWERGFIKPMVGATARETLRFANDRDGVEAAQKHLDRTLAREGMMVQPYLHRVEEEGELSAIFIDGEITHSVRKIPVKGDYRVQDDFGAWDGPVELTPDQRELFERVMEAARACCPGWGDGPLLYARVDLLGDNDGGLCVTELEMVEPSLFFRHGKNAADALAESLCRRIGA